MRSRNSPHSMILLGTLPTTMNTASLCNAILSLTLLAYGLVLWRFSHNVGCSNFTLCLLLLQRLLLLKPEDEQKQWLYISQLACTSTQLLISDQGARQGDTRLCSTSLYSQGLPWFAPCFCMCTPRHHMTNIHKFCSTDHTHYHPHTNIARTHLTEHHRVSTFEVCLSFERHEFYYGHHPNLLLLG